MFRAGQTVEDHCRVCKEPRDHRVIAVDDAGHILRVICGFCGSQHNYRHNRTPGERERAPGARVMASADASGEVAIVTPAERGYAPVEIDEHFGFEGDEMDLELLLRKVIREELGLTPTALEGKWRGGQMILRPGKPGLQEKVVPLETLFNKIVMIRNRLRVLEQQVNASELPAEEKLKLQGYITGAYGSLTTFNVLFADEDDKFKGSGGD